MSILLIIFCIWIAFCVCSAIHDLMPAYAHFCRGSASTVYTDAFCIKNFERRSSTESAIVSSTSAKHINKLEEI